MSSSVAGTGSASPTEGDAGRQRAKLSSAPDMAAWFASMPPDSFSPPELAAGVIARIAAGDFDQRSGSFLDATTDLDAMVGAGERTRDANTLRIAQS